MQNPGSRLLAVARFNDHYSKAGDGFSIRSAKKRFFDLLNQSETTDSHIHSPQNQKLLIS